MPQKDPVSIKLCHIENLDCISYELWPKLRRGHSIGDYYMGYRGDIRSLDYSSENIRRSPYARESQPCQTATAKGRQIDLLSPILDDRKPLNLNP